MKIFESNECHCQAQNEIELGNQFEFLDEFHNLNFEDLIRLNEPEEYPNSPNDQQFSFENVLDFDDPIVRPNLAGFVETDNPAESDSGGDYFELQNVTQLDSVSSYAVADLDENSWMIFNDEKVSNNEGHSQVHSPKTRRPRRLVQKAPNITHWLAQKVCDPSLNDIIAWKSQSEGIFKILDQNRLAEMWGCKKKRKRKMNFAKFTRSMRYHYVKSVHRELELVEHKHQLEYKFSKDFMIRIVSKLIQNPMN